MAFANGASPADATRGSIERASWGSSGGESGRLIAADPIRPGELQSNNRQNDQSGTGGAGHSHEPAHAISIRRLCRRLGDP